MKNKKSKIEMSADLDLFINIQVSNYLLQCNKENFDDAIEEEYVTSLIIDVWDDIVSQETEKLNTLDDAAKTEWFNSLEIEFDREDTENRIPLIKDGSINPYNLEDRIFPDLSESQLDLIPYCWVVLEPIGYKYQRFKDIVAGVDPAEIEIELFRWSYEIVSYVNDSVRAKSRKMAEEIIYDAHGMACEKMDEGAADETILLLQMHLLREAKRKKRKGII
jgi:hypothetical protein